jgi:tripartite-type tricarboxylate transporter receptor subunit TctC
VGVRSRVGAAIGGAAAAALLLLAAPAADAQDAVESYPTKPIRLVVGYAPGGANDILARVVGQKLSDSLGQPVVVENKPGAQSIIAAELVAKSPPDGYTLLTGASGPIVFNPATYAKLPYDPQKDFAPISVVGSFPLILVVGEASPFHSLQQLVEFARANPEKANYGASAASFQLATELFKQKTGTQFVHIPYKGSAESVNAVAAGDVTMALVDAGPATIAMRAGRVRGLAVTAPRRIAEWPELPTMAELGVPGMEVELWTGLLAPAGTPAPIVGRLEAEIARIVRLPAVAERL